jgi:hypothetical protein
VATKILFTYDLKNRKRNKKAIWINVIYGELYSGSEEANKQPPDYYGITMISIKLRFS